jgi:methionyl-tRNA synthetase
MVFKYFGGTLPALQKADPADDELVAMASTLRDRYEVQMEQFAFQNALVETFRVISRANKYIDETAPWVLARSEENRPRLARVMYNLLETARICGVLLTPFMPTPREAFRADRRSAGRADRGCRGPPSRLPKTVAVAKGENLFPRIDLKKELAALESRGEATAPETGAAAPISIDDFAKVEMTVCKVLSCEHVEKSDKLLKFQLNDGSGTPRQILSGIAKFYKPEELIGRTVVACTNLPPRRMMGTESDGMLLSAERYGALHFSCSPTEFRRREAVLAEENAQAEPTDSEAARPPERRPLLVLLAASSARAQDERRLLGGEGTAPRRALGLRQNPDRTLRRREQIRYISL